MDIRQLNALVAVADHGSFSAAARALSTVQSNVSAHVARLERELGAVLVDRGSGLLTPEGEVVVTRGRRVLAELDAVGADVASLRANPVGRARFGVIGTTARWLAPSLLDTMAERHPGVELAVIDATSSSLLLALVSGHLDLAVLNLPVDDPEVATEHLFEEDRVLVAPEGHPLARHDRISLGDLAGQPLLLEPKGTAFRDELDEACSAAGVELVAKAEIEGMRLLATLAFDGFGAAVLPATALPVPSEGTGRTDGTGQAGVPAQEGGAWKSLPVDGLEPRSVGIATLRRALLPAPARALRDVVVELVRAEAPRQPGLHVDIPAR